MEHISTAIVRLLVSTQKGLPKHIQKKNLIAFREHGVLTNSEAAIALELFDINNEGE